ncbi:helix-turn-helix domain-containing protein [Cutibacterium granulosum]|uniref:helix-turn-helix domain-containing protein n=1 Tax=Cutibacterium granulosum TaxID=33011 RepID=UPI00396A798A
MVVARSVRTAIALSGTSIAATARAANISSSTLHRILSGDREATATTLYALARATDIPVTRLVDGSLCKECITHD